MWQMCQMPNIWHICQTKHKKHLPSDVLYVPIFYHLCQYCCKFAMLWTQMVNWKILFYSTFLSPFLESLSLSPKFPTCVLPLLTIGREQKEGGGGNCQERRKGSRRVRFIDGGRWVWIAASGWWIWWLKVVLGGVSLKLGFFLWVFLLQSMGFWCNLFNLWGFLFFCCNLGWSDIAILVSNCDGWFAIEVLLR